MRFYIFIFAFFFSLSANLMQRGVFFYTQFDLGLSEMQNLMIALSTGVSYICGAQLSYRLIGNSDPRRSMIILVLIQIASPLAAFFYCGAVSVTVLVAIFAFFNGMTWPAAESYASAGLDERQSSRSIGIYNLCWSTAAPIAIWISGFIVSYCRSGIFLVICLLSLIAAAMVVMLPKLIPHHSSPEQAAYSSMSQDEIREKRGMMFSGRWSMAFSYALLQLLSSLLPGRLQAIGLSVSLASVLAGFIDASRTAAFIGMTATTWWHDRKLLLATASPLLVVGFCLCMFTDRIPLMLSGEIIFGTAAGLSYYAALYYAMVLSNASVGAGGAHETVIGAGFTVGPVITLLGKQIAIISGLSLTAGLVFGVVPMILVAVPASIFCLRSKRG